MTGDKTQDPAKDPVELDDAATDQATGGGLSHTQIKPTSFDQQLAAKTKGLREQGRVSGIRMKGVRKKGIRF